MTSTDTIKRVMFLAASSAVDRNIALYRAQLRRQAEGSPTEEHFIEVLKQEAEAAILQDLPCVTGNRREGGRVVEYLESIDHAIRATLDEDEVLDAVVPLLMAACKTDGRLRDLICEHIGKDNALGLMDARGLLGD